MEIFTQLLPEILLTLAALVLFMLGIVRGPGGRRLVPWVALAGVVAALVVAFVQSGSGRTETDWTGGLLPTDFAGYVKIITAGVGILFVLLSWPTNADATGNSSLRYGLDSGEYFGLLLLALAGVMLTGTANDMILLFMGIELASIPTYIMVSMSRPLPAAQEAGVKYFFLGAMSAAILLLGFGYLYGATGTTNMTDAGRVFAGSLSGLGYDSPAHGVTDTQTWQLLGLVLVVLGLCFKLAAVPLHFYAGDVYTGAGTPVTAMLSFVPKATGIVAAVKVLAMVGGNGFYLPDSAWKLLLVIAVLTMTAGNVLALLADNLKRVMAYSSVAHSGYMLAALTALAAGGSAVVNGGDAQAARGVAVAAVTGVLFYLAAYGVMNTGVFGVLMMLPTRRRITDPQGNVRRLPATSAETFADLAGAGRRHPVLAAAMTVCCISLIGIPLTVGFLGKLYVIRPAVEMAGVAPGGSDVRTAMFWLVGFTLLNAAVGAAYYLRIIATMTLMPSPEEEDAEAEGQGFTPAPAPRQPAAFVIATGISAVGALLLGTVPWAVNRLNDAADAASQVALATPRAAPEAEGDYRDAPDEVRVEPVSVEND